MWQVIDEFHIKTGVHLNFGNSNRIKLYILELVAVCQPK